MMEVALFGAGRIGKIHGGNVAARSMRSAWVSVGEQMATASTSLAAKIASISATFAPVAFAKAAAAAGSASAT